MQNRLYFWGRADGFMSAGHAWTANLCLSAQALLAKSRMPLVLRVKRSVSSCQNDGVTGGFGGVVDGNDSGNPVISR